MLTETEEKVQNAETILENERQKLKERKPRARATSFRPAVGEEEEVLDVVVLAASDSPPLNETYLYRPPMRVEVYDEQSGKWEPGRVIGTDTVLGVQVSFGGRTIPSRWFHTSHITYPGTHTGTLTSRRTRASC